MKRLKAIVHLIKLRYIFLLAGLIILTGCLALQYESWRTVTYVIPPGVEAGQAIVDVPDEIILMVGLKDTIVIKNQDNAIHTFGPFVIGPESTFSHRFRSPRLFEAACTFHPDKQMRVQIKPAPWSLAY